MKKNSEGLESLKSFRGPDELHSRVLKGLAFELGPIFAHLFQQSVDIGEIPKELANISSLQTSILRNSMSHLLCAST